MRIKRNMSGWGIYYKKDGRIVEIGSYSLWLALLDYWRFR